MTPTIPNPDINIHETNVPQEKTKVVEKPAERFIRLKTKTSLLANQLKEALIGLRKNNPQVDLNDDVTDFENEEERLREITERTGPLLVAQNTGGQRKDIQPGKRYGIVFDPKAVEKRRENYEKIPREEIDSVVERYREFYHLPAEVVQRGAQTQGFMLSEDELVQESILRFYNKLKYDDSAKKEFSKLLKRLKSTDQALSGDQNNRSSRDLLRKPREIIQEIRRRVLIELKKRAISEEVRMVGGEIAFLDDGRRIIYINRDSGMDTKEALDHEVLHDLSTDSEASGIEAPSYEDQRYKLFNEAATEILRIGEKYPDLSVPELYEKSKQGAIHVSYAPAVERLLGVIVLVNVNGVPFSVKDLSEYYFGLNNMSGISRGLILEGVLLGLLKNEDDKLAAKEILEPLKE